MSTTSLCSFLRGKCPQRFAKQLDKLHILKCNEITDTDTTNNGLTMTDTDYQSDYWWVHHYLCIYKKLRITISITAINT